RDRARPAAPSRARARRRRQRPHEPRDARDHRREAAGEPSPCLLRQLRARVDRRAADHLGSRPARRDRARGGLSLRRAGRDPGRARGRGAGVPRARGTRLPPRPDRAWTARPAGAAHPARAGGDDRAAPARARGAVVILLNPGPVNVSPRVRAALAREDICHREPEFADLQDSIRARLVDAFAPRAGFTSVLITGSGTAALETAVTSVLSARGRLVVVSNGVYGERITAMAAAAGLPHTTVECAWTD